MRLIKLPMYVSPAAAPDSPAMVMITGKEIAEKMKENCWVGNGDCGLRDLAGDVFVQTRMELEFWNREDHPFMWFSWIIKVVTLFFHVKKHNEYENNMVKSDLFLLYIIVIFTFSSTL